jgi:predicted membrane protein
VKKLTIIAVLVFVMVVLSACAAGPNAMVNTANTEGQVAGFWLGLWHGFISPVTFIISLFNHNVGIYEAFNNGGWYNFGFILGVMIIFGGGGNRSRGRC